MRIRSLTILASSTLAALLGCPLDSLQGTADPASGPNDSGSGLIADNTERHDDRIDAADDVSWVQQEPLPAGRSALRVLMTDAPIDAENVFVTFCGVQVHAAAAATTGGAGDARPVPGVGGYGGAGGAPSAGGAPGAGGASSAGGSAGGAPSDGGSDDGSTPDAADGDDAAGADAESAETDAERAETDAERAAADAERQRIEAERAEAERERIEAERAEGQSAGGAGSQGTGGRSSDGSAVPDVTAPGDDAAGSWLTIADGCQTLDLLTLQNGVTEAIGVTTLPPGNYGQIRLMLVDASIVRSGIEQALTLPSGTESGLKIVGGFTLRDGVATTITLDFDAGRSIHYAAGTGFMMTPVIEVIDVTTHGDAGDGAGEGDVAKPSDEGRAGAPGVAGAGGRGGAEAAPTDMPPPPPRPEGMPPADADPRPEVPPPPADKDPRAEPPPPPAEDAVPAEDGEKP